MQALTSNIQPVIEETWRVLVVRDREVIQVNQRDYARHSLYWCTRGIMYQIRTRRSLNAQGYRNGTFSKIKKNPCLVSLGLRGVRRGVDAGVRGVRLIPMAVQQVEAGCMSDFPEGLGFGG